MSSLEWLSASAELLFEPTFRSGGMKNKKISVEIREATVVTVFMQLMEEYLVQR